MSKAEKFKPAKVCFGHIGGKLGMLLMDAFIKKAWIAKAKPGDKHFYITVKGQRGFTRLGADVARINSENLE